jgi:hypothetical protein
MLPRLVFLKDLSLKNEIFNQTTYILNIKPGFLIIYKKKHFKFCHRFGFYPSKLHGKKLGRQKKRSWIGTFVMTSQ